MPAFVPDHLLPRLAGFADAPRGWVAYSGGMDSEVLLHALAALRGGLPFELRAVHVDHGLHADSPTWAAHCRERCARLGVPLAELSLGLVPRRGESLEATARTARYGAIQRVLGAGDLLLTAHHRDDQAETLLLALMRGSGPKGLAAMPTDSPFGPGRLVRLLLDWPRTALLGYARAQGLTWADDPSNADLGRDRNFVRHRVLPLLAERWPACTATIARSAGLCAEAQGLVEGLADRVLGEVAGGRPATLSVAGIRGLDGPLGRAVLRRWLAGLRLPVPDAGRLARILDEVLAARADAVPLVAWPGCQVRRYRDELFAMAPLPLPVGDSLVWCNGDLMLPGGLGTLTLADARGRRVDPVTLTPDGLRVRLGAAGLACRTGGGHRRPLKHLFQEAGIPPWLRAYVPVVFAGDEPIGIGDWWRCRSSRVLDDNWHVRWRGGLRGHPGFPPVP
jgi:tRNA(Ile)-lysidine synthase